MGAGSPLAEESRQESVTYATCTQLAGQPIKSCRNSVFSLGCVLLLKGLLVGGNGYRVKCKE
jgi:hypothetical protein